MLYSSIFFSSPKDPFVSAYSWLAKDLRILRAGAFNAFRIAGEGIQIKQKLLIIQCFSGRADSSAFVKKYPEK